ncbi:NERD domain-containing protein [Oceanobacillus damuensis]|uniref:NERD domain-containing protein n=1 Tax=Oceanobacillus damuensis TaxID=937928 RepID=UPI0008341EAB|nr:NERD domain-containing protein [Oceanobacillus damuensis]
MLIYIILILLFLFLGYVQLNFANIKGSYGEKRVNKILAKLDENEYKIYHDLYIPTGENKTTQIDHVVTSPYGIFVIETKHYNGWIFGNEKNRYWTQVIYKRKEKLFNPIWQNAGHIKSLENYLEIDKQLFSSIIAFSNQSTFKFKEVFTRAKVIHFTELIKTIKKKESKIISNDQLQEINSKLEKLIITDKKVKRKISKGHVNTVKLDTVKRKATYYDKTKCPKCHSDLIKRKGKYGDFMGCSSYPKCRYTRKLS